MQDIGTKLTRPLQFVESRQIPDILWSGNHPLLSTGIAMTGTPDSQRQYPISLTTLKWIEIANKK